MDDALVIGAGIAGSSYALAMAKKGYSVTVIEAAQHVGDNVWCGGGFTNKAVAEFPWLKKYHDHYDGRLITGAQWVYGDRRIDLPGTDMLVCSRNQFDAFLAGKAQEHGAAIHCSQKALRIKQERGSVHVVTNAGEYEGRTLMDASGEFGPIQGSGLCYKKKYAQTLQWEFRLSPEKVEELAGNSIQLIFPKKRGGSDIGYAWIFPRQSAIHVGAGSSQNSKGVNQYLRTVIQESIKDYLPDLDGLAPSKERGALLPHPSSIPSRLDLDRVMIAGDAASAVNAQGEGNYYSLLESSVAAAVCDEQLSCEHVRLQEYSEAIAPLNLSLAESAVKMEKILSSPLLKSILFGIIPRSEKLTQKFTDMIRKSSFDAHHYNMLDL